MTRRYRGRPSVGTVVGFSLCFLVFTAVGAFFFWGQHFGVPARMTVVSCTRGQLFTCSGLLAGKGTGPAADRAIFILGAGPEDVGHDIDVHFDPHSGFAPIADADWMPLLILGAGGVSGVCAVFFIVTRRQYPKLKAEAIRRSRVEAARSGVIPPADEPT
jgi:hypothetical protein